MATALPLIYHSDVYYYRRTAGLPPPPPRLASVRSQAQLPGRGTMPPAHISMHARTCEVGILAMTSRSSSHLWSPRLP